MLMKMMMMMMMMVMMMIMMIMMSRWNTCLGDGGWARLPSGRLVCYVATAMKHQARAEHCERLGGSLLEVRTADDAQELAEIVWRLTKDYLRSTSWIATGGWSS